MTMCTRLLEFDSAHRVLRHESKCSTLHGHRYRVEVTCEADQLDDVGRVVDFGVIKQLVGGWVDEHWDHTAIVNVRDEALLSWCMMDAEEHAKKLPYVMPDEPTAENMARLLLGVARRLLADHELSVIRVRVWETPNCYADAMAGDTLAEATQP